jgi:hypothetical protein
MEPEKKGYKLTANLKKYPIENSLGLYKFAGDINADVNLSGRIGSLSGKGAFDIDNGKILVFADW